jgi:hypothetical protein
MGNVCKAHDTVIGRDMAIKVLPTELGAEPRRWTRLFLWLRTQTVSIAR